MRQLFDFVALDIETTGFDFVDEEIIEIGAVKYLKGKETDRYSVFIKPHKPVPQFIKQLTHITDKQLAGGMQLNEAINGLKAFAGDHILLCHNAAFDVGFINAKCDQLKIAPLLNRILDTLELSRIYLPFIPNHQLGTVAEYFSIDLSNAHRAIFDAQATGEILLNLIDFIDEYIPLKLNYRISEVAARGEYTSMLADFVKTLVEHQKKHALLRKAHNKINFHNRNYIEHNPQIAMGYDIPGIFDEGGVLAQKFENYELRSGQMQMAQAIREIYDRNEFLLVEAGTGVGKSLAYLIPSIMFTNENETKVVISTNTKNLQEQLFYKDLPLVRDCLNMPFRATLLKGRRNYLCERRWAESQLDMERMFSPWEAQHYINLLVWREFTKTGDVSENTSFNPRTASSVWKKLAADRHMCRGKRCSHAKHCFLMDVRQKAENSNLIIINHHLLLADMQSENAALGEYDFLVVDEAHNLPHLAPAELGISLSYADFSTYFQQLFSARGKYQSGILATLKAAANKSSFDPTQKEQLLLAIEQAAELIKSNKETFTRFFTEVGTVVKDKGSYGKLRIRRSEDMPFISHYLAEVMKFWDTLGSALLRVSHRLEAINSMLFVDHDIHTDSIQNALKQHNDFFQSFEILYNPDLKDFAFWLSVVQSQDAAYPAGVLEYAPLNVDELLHRDLYEKKKSVVFTSATLAIRGVFKYFRTRMGLNLLEDGFVQELVVDSPFDYHTQTGVVVAGFLPQPNDRFFNAQATDIIKRAIQVSKTGTMTLFTSYKDLNATYEALSDAFYAAGIKLMAQGKGMGRSAMLKEFKKHKDSVLFGTNSFWEGIDVQGESLSLLILYKIPFMVPSEPIVEAFMERLQAEGKDSFMHYMLPNAILKYRQGFGRLIRHKSDRGIVLVLDNRLVTKHYGRYFLDTIPSRTTVASSPMEIYDILGQWFM
jgi:predicted DnaQ family exonuclease/DinG family helicase